jgi:hypothetical protein
MTPSPAVPAPDREKTVPERVQLRRSKGWRMPPDTVKVDRTTRWGNPFSAVECGSTAAAVARHAEWMRGEVEAPGGRVPPSLDEIRSQLSGRRLACWCPLDGPCHANLLIRLANFDDPESGTGT